MKNFVAVMDSGVGGITTLAEIIRVVKGGNFIYFADKKFVPYGDKSEEEIKRRVSYIASEFFLMGACALVIACNTATSVCIDLLRKEFSDKIIIGTEPAVKLASERCSKTAVLVTPLTAKQKKFEILMQKYAKNYDIYAMKNLAMQIENNIGNLEKVFVEASDEIDFLKNYDSVVLGCTHYVFLKPFLQKRFPKLKILDGNNGVANRLDSLLKNDKIEQNENSLVIKFFDNEQKLLLQNKISS